MINQLTKELDMMKAEKEQAINLKHYSDWSAHDFANYIERLDDGRFKKYVDGNDGLRSTFIEENVDGMAIKDKLITKADWKTWGVTDFKDRSRLAEHVNKL